METIKIALFGEAERGEYQKPHYLRDLEGLLDSLGQPPEDSEGLHFAVQALMQRQELLYFRVEEEGFSLEDYYQGLTMLRDKSKVPSFQAIYLPGVGDHLIIDACTQICESSGSVLLMNESDFFDYITSC